jgi:hypothetical protein
VRHYLRDFLNTASQQAAVCGPKASGRRRIGGRAREEEEDKPTPPAFRIQTQMTMRSSREKRRKEQRSGRIEYSASFSTLSVVPIAQWTSPNASAFAAQCPFLLIASHIHKAKPDFPFSTRRPFLSGLGRSRQSGLIRPDSVGFTLIGPLAPCGIHPFRSSIRHSQAGLAVSEAAASFRLLAFVRGGPAKLQNGNTLSAWASPLSQRSPINCQ